MLFNLQLLAAGFTLLLNTVFATTPDFIDKLMEESSIEALGFNSGEVLSKMESPNEKAFTYVELLLSDALSEKKISGDALAYMWVLYHQYRPLFEKCDELDIFKSSRKTLALTVDGIFSRTFEAAWKFNVPSDGEEKVTLHQLKLYNDHLLKSKEDFNKAIARITATDDIKLDECLTTLKKLIKKQVRGYSPGSLEEQLVQIYIIFEKQAPIISDLVIPDLSEVSSILDFQKLFVPIFRPILEDAKSQKIYVPDIDNPISSCENFFRESFGAIAKLRAKRAEVETVSDLVGQCNNAIYSLTDLELRASYRKQCTEEASKPDLKDAILGLSALLKKIEDSIPAKKGGNRSCWYLLYAFLGLASLGGIGWAVYHFLIREKHSSSI
jgi:hypothetical protein